MILSVVRAQLRDIYTRLVQVGLSVKQFYPSDVSDPNGSARIGDLATTAVALKDVAYEVIYEELEKHDGYHVKLPDGGLLIFQYVFSDPKSIVKHRLAYFPSPTLPTIDEAPNLYEHDELYADILLARLVRFPVRFDFDPRAHRDVIHPQSHLTLGQFQNCRIPVTSAVMPNTFVLFLLRNFYFRSYLKNKNLFDRRMNMGKIDRTLTQAEARIAHFVMN